MHPVLFYLPGERLSQAELCAARLDGDVVEVGEGYVPCDTVEGPAARALSLARLVPRGGALHGASAAWVHGAGDRPPTVHHVARIRSTRPRIAMTSRVIHHDRRLPADDVQWIADVCVATPLATAVSLLFSSARSEDDGMWLAALLDASPRLREEARERVLPLGRRPGARHVQRVLDAWAAQEVVTRYTS